MHRRDSYISSESFMRQVYQVTKRVVFYRGQPSYNSPVLSVQVRRGQDPKCARQE